jgi:hypothetical protein
MLCSNAVWPRRSGVNRKRPSLTPTVIVWFLSVHNGAPTRIPACSGSRTTAPHIATNVPPNVCAQTRNIILVRTPVHDSRLNQIEVYFSSVQRKLLNPKDFSTLAALKSDLIRFPTTLRKIALLDHLPRRREGTRGAPRRPIP